MKCPVCSDSTLLMADRQGVEIDYCPQCRGVWLDRGELDKLLQLAAGSSSAGHIWPITSRSQGSRPDVADSSHHVDHDRRHRHKKSWLSEIFD